MKLCIGDFLLRRLQEVGKTLGSTVKETRRRLWKARLRHRVEGISRV